MVSFTLEKLIGAKFDLKTCYGLGKQLLKSVLMAKIYQGPRAPRGDWVTGEMAYKIALCLS
jgi:hypothetical protein